MVSLKKNTENSDQPFLAEAQVKTRQKKKPDKCAPGGSCESHVNCVYSFTEYFPFVVFRCSAA